MHNDERQLACKTPDVNPDDWFAWPGSERSNKAKELCMGCPAYHECALYALKEGIPEGVWGGMDERERERIWEGTPGGRPTAFEELLDAWTRARPIVTKRERDRLERRLERDRERRRELEEGAA